MKKEYLIAFAIFASQPILLGVRKFIDFKIAEARYVKEKTKYLLGKPYDATVRDPRK